MCYFIVFVCVFIVVFMRMLLCCEMIVVRVLKFVDGVVDVDYVDVDVWKDSDDECGVDINYKCICVSFEMCLFCFICVFYFELGEDDVVDLCGWCERCDCDVKVECIDVGNLGRYVGKFEVMVL